jgi:hypothetical protein
MNAGIGLTHRLGAACDTGPFGTRPAVDARLNKRAVDPLVSPPLPSSSREFWVARMADAPYEEGTR